MKNMKSAAFPKTDSMTLTYDSVHFVHILEDISDPQTLYSIYKTLYLITNVKIKDV